MTYIEYYILQISSLCISDKNLCNKMGKSRNSFKNEITELYQLECREKPRQNNGYRPFTSWQ